MARWAGNFVLLKDFWSAYDPFPLKVVGLQQRLERHIVAPMENALRERVGTLRTVDRDEVDDAVSDLGLKDYFVITMDGGSSFDAFDFSFEITRAAYQLSDVLAGRFFRMARQGKPAFYQQTMRVRSLYKEHGHGRPIVLCDDGIGTGTSVREVMASLARLDLVVTKVIVLINPNRRDAVDDTPVVTLVKTQKDVLWLSERDLFWGLPRSGVSFTRWDDVNPRFGLPYSIDADLASARIGLSLEVAKAFRQDCLAINERFWLLHEQAHGRPLQFTQCPRLAFLPEYVNVASLRVASFLAEISDPDFRVMSRAKSAEMELGG